MKRVLAHYMTPIDPLKRCDYNCFPRIKIFFKYTCNITPATTASAERNFSLLQRIKTKMRSRTKEDQLNGLDSLHAHRDITINSENVNDVFAKSKRWLDFVS